MARISPRNSTLFDDHHPFKFKRSHPIPRFYFLASSFSSPRKNLSTPIGLPTASAKTNQPSIDPSVASAKHPDNLHAILQKQRRSRRTLSFRFPVPTSPKTHLPPLSSDSSTDLTYEAAPRQNSSLYYYLSRSQPRVIFKRDPQAQINYSRHRAPRRRRAQVPLPPVDVLPPPLVFLLLLHPSPFSFDC